MSNGRSANWRALYTLEFSFGHVDYYSAGTGTMEKEYYNTETVLEKFGVLSENFILYKTLLGDNSDKIPGVKGLGEKGIFKKFPELKTQVLTLEDIFDISARKFKEHVVYSRIVQNRT